MTWPDVAGQVVGLTAMLAGLFMIGWFILEMDRRERGGK